jgi:DNA-binding transcriptional regulator YiaG
MGQIVQSSNSEADVSPARRARRVLGSHRLAAICGLTENAVYKWDRARSKGGTGGLVPSQFQARILAVVEEEGLGLTARDLIAEPVL